MLARFVTRNTYNIKWTAQMIHNNAETLDLIGVMLTPTIITALGYYS